MKTIRLSNSILTAVVSDSDYPEVRQRTWRLSQNGYVYTGKGNVVSLHRFVMGAKPGDGKMIDHINRDPLDNRRENLRFCTASENMQNRKLVKGWGTRRHVHYETSRKKYVARYYRLDGVRVFVGRFASKEDAIMALDKI